MKSRNKKVVFVYAPAAVFFIAVIILALTPVKLEPEKGYFSRIVLDKDGELLRVFLNKDEQWVYPDAGMPVPEKLKICVINFEDRRFFYHPGIDPVAVLRAFYGNISGSKKSGASTITMQLARLTDPKSRTYFSKLVEMFQSIRIEIKLSKEDILKNYLIRAPYGRNIIGYQTASLRYFGKHAEELSWAESALLAVLPNSPGGMSPGINHDRLLKKRNRLLKKLADEGEITQEQCGLALMEYVTIAPTVFPKDAPHATEYCVRNSRENIIRSTIDSRIQRECVQIVSRHAKYLNGYGINNICVIVSETATGKIRAYVGSQDYWDDSRHGKIDGVIAERSSGSILKPFLYAKAIDEGMICERTLMEDVPVNISSFSPKNADDTFSGLSAAKNALTASLNVPAVILLKKYGLFHFYEDLKAMGVKSLRRSSDDYGLSLIIGGAEISLWDVVMLYRGLGNYGEFKDLTLFEDQEEMRGGRQLSKGAAYLTLKMLEDVKRPGIEYFRQALDLTRPVSWKTGTSYGHKDAWAAGVTPEWTVGVWAGNFSGESNKMISGSQTAGPVLFDIINSISKSGETFYSPAGDLKTTAVCSETGYQPTEDCPGTEFVFMPEKSKNLPLCPYHKKIFLSGNGKEQVCSLCRDDDYEEKVVLSYPPLISRTLRSAGSEVYMPPAHRQSCASFSGSGGMSIIYPLEGSKIFIPKKVDGKDQKIKLDVAHSQKRSKIFWYIDGIYTGSTEEEHRIYLNFEKGEHTLTVIDNEGKTERVNFEVL